MKTNTIFKSAAAAMIIAALSSCASSGSGSSPTIGYFNSGANSGEQGSGPQYVPSPNGKGGTVLAPRWQ